ncbi:Wzz/FepE/Etk N-terminal domain-containing protein [Mangrovicoccus sp. HB161399]|uniref:GumC family protein n=1 Tax=Mangrovicoccus sp. HB161399 TaxID=2720392 RepID=UPI001552A42E|nr:Wzz/FepE/Etk N-terminal domain-containing protein [Mangrovicoccus sp. HB161399]
MRIDFSYYISVFWRRFHYFFVIASCFTVVGFAVAIMMPPEYTSSARLLVESPQISDRLASSTVDVVANEQLQVIEQRVMARSNLIDIATNFEVFPEQASMNANEIVKEMRDRTEFTIYGGRNQATFVDVSFRGSNPEVVARVANELVTQILDVNVRLRTVAAGDTMDFFKEEVSRLSVELDQQSARILEFKSKNADALPENRDYLTERLGSLLDTVRTLESQAEGLREQRKNAQELFEANGASSTAVLTPDEAALEEARRQLDSALAVFAPDNPRLKMLESRVAQLEARIGNGGDDPGEPGQAVLDAQLAQIDERLSATQRNIDDAKAELAKLQDNLAKLPAATVTLDGLQRDYDNTQSQYRDAVARLAQAETGERIELGGKSQRISVVEQATKPEKPSKPNRPLIAAAGLGLGVSAGIGFIALLELLNRSIRRPVEISDKLGIATFAVIPLIRTEQETRWRRMVMLTTIVLLFVAIPLAVWAVHVFVMPLDVFAERIANKVGMSVTLSN